MNIAQIVIGIVVAIAAVTVGLILLYLAARFVSAGWHRSKAEAQSQSENKNG